MSAAALGKTISTTRCFWGTQGFPGSPVLGVVVLFACAQARYSVPEPRVCGRLRLRRLSEGSQVTSCYKGSTYLLFLHVTLWALGASPANSRTLDEVERERLLSVFAKTRPGWLQLSKSVPKPIQNDRLGAATAGLAPALGYLIETYSK